MLIHVCAREPQSTCSHAHHTVALQLWPVLLSSPGEPVTSHLTSISIHEKEMCCLEPRLQLGRHRSKPGSAVSITRGIQTASWRHLHCQGCRIKQAAKDEAFALVCKDIPGLQLRVGVCDTGSNGGENSHERVPACARETRQDKALETSSMNKMPTCLKIQPKLVVFLLILNVLV